ncbi:hypothetical protein D3C71_1620150 [compost metagenome]
MRYLLPRVPVALHPQSFFRLAEGFLDLIRLALAAADRCAGITALLGSDLVEAGFDVAADCLRRHPFSRQKRQQTFLRHEMEGFQLRQFRVLHIFLLQTVKLMLPQLARFRNIRQH